MRHTYRYKNNFQYWTDRWEDLEVDSVMSNKDIYPLKYSENLINNDKHNSILEAGCGNGRLLKYYHNNGYDIFGIDFIDSAVKKLKKSDNSLKVEKMSIFNTNFSDNKFNIIISRTIFLMHLLKQIEFYLTLEYYALLLEQIIFRIRLLIIYMKNDIKEIERKNFITSQILKKVI